MATKKKPKSAHVPAIEISVDRFRFLYYQDRRMSWGYWLDLGYNSADFAFAKSRFEPPILNTPMGVFGAPVQDYDKHTVMKFATQLLRNEKNFNPDDLVFKIRYHVMLGDVITVDEPPGPDGVPDHSKNKGYKTLDRAQIAAQDMFRYYDKTCRTDKNQPSQPVRLFLEDKDGKITKKNNGYKPLLKP